MRDGFIEGMDTRSFIYTMMFIHLNASEQTYTKASKVTSERDNLEAMSKVLAFIMQNILNFMNRHNQR